MPLKDYLTIQSDKTQKALMQIEDLRAANPEQAAQEDQKMKQEIIKKKEEYISRRLKLGLANDYKEANAEVEAKKELIKIEQSNEAAAKR